MNSINSINIKHTKRNLDIAMFTDYPNVDIGVRRNTFESYYNYGMVETYVKTMGNLRVSRVYGDWQRYKIASKYLSRYNVKLVDVRHIIFSDNRSKDLVDTKMAMDIGTMLLECPDIQLIVIVSGDADFIPVIKTIKEYNIKVYVIAEQNSLSHHLFDHADKIIFYQDVEEMCFDLENTYM